MLQTKYQTSSPCSIRQEDFKGFPFRCHGNHSSAWNTFLLDILVEDQQTMLHTKYQSSRPNGFRQEEFYAFPFSCHGNQSSAWNAFLLAILVEEH